MKRINFIPLVKGGFRQGWIKKRFWEARFLIILISFIFFLILGSLWQTIAVSGYKKKVSKDKKNLTEIQHQLATLESEVAQIQKEKDKKGKEVARLEDKLLFLEQTKEGSIKWTPILMELSQLVPQQIWMNKISLKDELITLKGNAFNNSVVSEFMVALEKSKHFQNTNFNYTQKVKDDIETIDFEVTTHLKE